MQMHVLWVILWIIYMTKKMNRFITALMCLAVTACTGTIDPEGDVDDGTLVLIPDVEKFFADGKSVVTFTVMDEDVDVTDDAVVTCMTTGQNVEGAAFSTDKAGEYKFRASYDGKVSQPESVVAMFKSQYERKVCVMEFTGTWCAQCPAGATILNFLASDMYKGEVNVLAFHNDDEYSLPVEQLLAAKYNPSGLYPYYLTDMRDSGELNGNGCSDSIYKSLYETETFCGPSVSCVYDETSGDVSVAAKVISEKTMEFRLAVYVVEDKVVGEQMQGTGTVDKDYVHRHVVRKMLSADYSGDRLGEIAAGNEVDKTYSFKVDPSWKPANVSVVILAIGPDGQVNNSASVKII